MKPMEALAVWANACDHTGIQWFLYRETLLCANGYHSFPQELTCAQIAVCDKDLTFLMESVFPGLPSHWQLSKKAFIKSGHQLTFREEGAAVLEVYVLHGVENETQMAALSKAMRQLNFQDRRKIAYGSILNKLGGKLFRKPYTATIGKLVNRFIQKFTHRAFNKMLPLAGKANEKAAFYSDCKTGEKPLLLTMPLLTETIAVSDGTREVAYPVFSGYREYLAHAFGDYENGLSDDVGVGLTTEEKEELKQHQAKCVEALAFLQELSQEFGLRYYLLAGSVLGAVRHGGFIPWDDDIDIGIRVEELEHFEAVVKAHFDRLPQGFTLKQSGANNPYPRMFSKICYNGRCCIDLWPLVPTQRSGFQAVYHWYFGKLITKVHYQKIHHPVAKFHRITKIAALVLSDKMAMALARRNEQKFLKQTTPIYINLYSIYHRTKEAIEREWLDEHATATFCGLEVPVVGSTEAYLTHLYGNYMAFPAPWKRGSRHVTRF